MLGGHQPELEAIAHELGIKLEEARRLQEFVEAVSPLEKLGNTDAESSRGIPESIEPRSVDRAIEQIELDQQMAELMKELSEREANIVKYRYGLLDGKAHTLEETGKKFRLTRERIRQIEKDVMKRLRTYVTAHKDDFQP